MNRTSSHTYAKVESEYSIGLKGMYLIVLNCIIKVTILQNPKSLIISVYCRFQEFVRRTKKFLVNFISNA